MSAARAGAKHAGLWGRARAIFIAQQHWLLPLCIFIFSSGVTVFAWRLQVLGIINNRPDWIFTIGIPASLIVSATVFQAMRQRRASDQDMARHLRALESLTKMSTEISSRLGAGREVLDALTGAACSLLGMRIAAISLLEDEGRSIRILASSGLDPVFTEPLSVKDAPSAKESLRTGRVVVIEDTTEPNAHVNRSLCERYHLGSIMQIPLIVGGKVIGFIFLGRHESYSFTDSDLRLAELWGSEAAVILANSQLYQQMDDGLRAYKRLLEHRDALFAVNAAIYQSSSVEAVLNTIVELAPGPLEVDCCQVKLCTEEPDEVVTVAVTKAYDRNLIGYRNRLHSGKYLARAIHKRSIVLIEDGRADPMLDPYLRTVLPVGSMMFVPLLASEGNTIGVLVLSRKAPGKFSQEQIDLVHLFAVRAAAAIENAQLHQQTRRDADAKAMLLRELNHRVKNNLASIVGLLSYREPALEPEARQWLDRVIDRIGAIARTHDMFSGGLERVQLADLVEQALRSITVAKPAGVQIRQELDDVTVLLRTDRAVTVAMIIHELTYNALVHGLGVTGTVTLRATLVEDFLKIEVVDDGVGIEKSENGVPAKSRVQEAESDQIIAVAGPTRIGMGLDLVRGLVGRELPGQFTLSPNPGGGTIATVQFPLITGETRGQSV